MRENWIETSLVNICEKAEKVKRNEKLLNESLIYLDIGGIDNKTNKIISHKEFTWENAPSRAQQIVKKGDVLFSTVRTYLKNIATVNNPLYHNQICSSGFTVIRGINGVVEQKLLFYFSLYNDFLNSLSKLQTGTSYPAVRDKDVFSQKFSLAPLPEQRAMVTKIEQLFSELDNGIAKQKMAQEQLKVYRQAVLKRAFEGDFKNKTMNEEVLLAAEPSENYSANKLPKGWKKYQFKDLLELRKDKHKPEKIENLFYIGLEHISKETGQLTENVGVEEIKTVKNKFYQGDILYGKLRPYLNKAYLAKQEGVCSTDILVFKPKEKVLGNLIIHYFLGREFVNDMSENTSGVNLPRVSTQYVENHKIHLPDIKEQHQIVQQIESRLSVCDMVEETITENLQKAEALRQSILKKAFAGELLTEGEIAACKKEKDWEPAGELLKRIKKEKTN